MKKSKPIDRDDLCYDEPVEENGLCDFLPAGTPIAQFIFDNNTSLDNEPMINQPANEISPNISLPSSFNLDLVDNRTLKSEPNGITPPIDGEYFVIKRGFTFLRSTVRMLNELKAIHPNENVYLSTIVDQALRHYHEYIFKEKDSQS